MGILDTLTGRTKVLRYRIIFGYDKTVGVQIEPCVPEIPPPDYVRLWASYEAKTIYNLGYPNNLSAMMAIKSISDASETDITADTDCFERADFADVMQFVPDVLPSDTVFTGEFYAKGSLERTIKTHLPLRSTEQQFVYSGLALMQYAILMNRDDVDTLDVLTKTARNFVSMYESGMGGGIQSIVQIPTLAYMQAIGLNDE